MNFVGNIEADQLPGGAAEVVVCDGFVGNIVLKLTEGIGHAVIEQIKETLGDTPEAQTLARKVFEKTNTLEAFGGGPLFGLKGVAVVGHGRSGPNSIANAIATAKIVIEKRYVEAQAAELARFRTEVGS